MNPYRATFDVVRGGHVVTRIVVRTDGGAA
jgi:hypothetical protein